MSELLSNPSHSLALWRNQSRVKHWTQNPSLATLVVHIVTRIGGMANGHDVDDLRIDLSTKSIFIATAPHWRKCLGTKFILSQSLVLPPPQKTRFFYILGEHSDKFNPILMIRNRRQVAPLSPVYTQYLPQLGSRGRYCVYRYSIKHIVVVLPYFRTESMVLVRRCRLTCVQARPDQYLPSLADHFVSE